MIKVILILFPIYFSTFVYSYDSFEKILDKKVFCLQLEDRLPNFCEAFNVWLIKFHKKSVPYTGSYEHDLIKKILEKNYNKNNYLNLEIYELDLISRLSHAEIIALIDLEVEVSNIKYIKSFFEEIEAIIEYNVKLNIKYIDIKNNNLVSIDSIIIENNLPYIKKNYYNRSINEFKIIDLNSFLKNKFFNNNDQVLILHKKVMNSFSNQSISKIEVKEILKNE